MTDIPEDAGSYPAVPTIDARTFECEIEIARKRGIEVGEGLVRPVPGGRVMITRLATNSWIAELLPLPVEREHYP